MISWNKGNSNFRTKKDDILVTINRYKPDIFAIHEANYRSKNDGHIYGYNVKCNTLIEGYDISRTILLLKKGISYKRRYDLENKYISRIWVQINISKTSSQSETIPSPPLPLMEVTIKQEHSLHIV